MAVLLVFSLLRLEKVCFASGQECGFEILERGDVSGYFEEAYFVVETEADWIRVWERHTSIREPKEPPPKVDFSVKFVVCAFMGQCPTTGYSIDVERIWTDGEQVFVEVVKRGSREGFAVGLMITCPYVMVLVEKIDMPFVFQVTENVNGSEVMLAEFSSPAVATLITALGCFSIFIKIKIKK
ncbi:MAG: protease complex subunit PrcB family protein [Candidatus Bathyarchaeia archaeon]